MCSEVHKLLGLILLLLSENVLNEIVEYISINILHLLKCPVIGTFKHTKK